MKWRKTAQNPAEKCEKKFADQPISDFARMHRKNVT